MKKSTQFPKGYPTIASAPIRRVYSVDKKSFVRYCTLFIIHSTLFICTSCQPKAVTPITDLLSKVWQAQTVKENELLVYSKGATNNIKPGYTSFRLDLSQPGQAGLKDLDGRLITGTWTVSTDNKRLILDNLNPKPTNTGGIIEYYILPTPDGQNLSLERTAESRKTGNSVNQYALVPE